MNILITTRITFFFIHCRMYLAYSNDFLSTLLYIFLIISWDSNMILICRRMNKHSRLNWHYLWLVLTFNPIAFFLFQSPSCSSDFIATCNRISATAIVKPVQFYWLYVSRVLHNSHTRWSLIEEHVFVSWWDTCYICGEEYRYMTTCVIANE